MLFALMSAGIVASADTQTAPVVEMTVTTR